MGMPAGSTGRASANPVFWGCARSLGPNNEEQNSDDHHWRVGQPATMLCMGVKSASGGYCNGIVPRKKGLKGVVIRMELRMGAASAILIMTSDGNASGARSVWASRNPKWDERARVVFWLPVGLSHLGRSTRRSSPYRFLELLPEICAPSAV